MSVDKGVVAVHNFIIVVLVRETTIGDYTVSSIVLVAIIVLAAKKMAVLKDATQSIINFIAMEKTVLSAFGAKKIVRHVTMKHTA